MGTRKLSFDHLKTDGDVRKYVKRVLRNGQTRDESSNTLVGQLYGSALEQYMLSLVYFLLETAPTEEQNLGTVLELIGLDQKVLIGIDQNTSHLSNYNMRHEESSTKTNTDSESENDKRVLIERIKDLDDDWCDHEDSPLCHWMIDSEDQNSLAYMYYCTFQNVKDDAFKSKVQLLLMSRIQKHLDFEDNDEEF